MPDIKVEESKKEDASAVAAQAAPKAAKKAPKAKTPKAKVSKPRAASTTRKKPAEAKGARASATTIAAPVVSRTARKIYTAGERTKKLGEIQKLVKGGTSISAATKKAGISEQTYYQWKKPAAPKASQSGDLKDLVKLEAENARLKKVLADRLRKENADLKKKLGIS